jgi:hypothetical protein
MASLSSASFDTILSLTWVIAFLLTISISPHDFPMFALTRTVHFIWVARGEIFIAAGAFYFAQFPHAIAVLIFLGERIVNVGHV